MNETYIQELQLKNFRCFKQAKFNLDAPIILIEGINGSGKTSLLEAIHYLCYVRSFRTHIPGDLVNFETDTFFIAATLQTNEVAIGSKGTKRQVKINQKPVTSYDQLRAVCRVVTVTQEDIDIVTASPEKRRTFIDNALALQDPSLLATMRLFRHILETRNAFLMNNGSDNDEFAIWTQKLWQASSAIQQARRTFLELLLQHAQALEGYFLPNHTCAITYHPKIDLCAQDYEHFYAQSQKLFERERFTRRSLFGAHLDDIEIIFNGKPARLFSSRGQQKLLTLFLKISQVSALQTHQGPVIFLLDDFLSDFDSDTISRVITTTLSLKSQLIFTSPVINGPEYLVLNKANSPFLKISI